MTFEEKAGLVPVAIDRGATDGVDRGASSPRPSLCRSESRPIAADESPRPCRSRPHDVVTRDASAPRRLGGPAVPLRASSSTAARSSAPASNVAAPRRPRARAASPPTSFRTYAASSRDDFDVRARMFAPLDGVPEDPATGSANCRARGAARVARPAARTGRSATASPRASRWDGRASSRRVSRRRPAPSSPRRIRGTSVLVGEGWIEVPGGRDARRAEAQPPRVCISRCGSRSSSAAGQERRAVARRRAAPRRRGRRGCARPRRGARAARRRSRPARSGARRSMPARRVEAEVPEPVGRQPAAVAGAGRRAPSSRR